eukprot:gene30727-40016_t
MPSPTFVLSVASWNVNGIRSMIKHDTEMVSLKNFIQLRNIDILCLQETKLQSFQAAEVESQIRSKIDASRIFWSCSEARKGYSGTAVLILNSSLNIDEGSVSYGINDEEGDAEGRSITISTDTFSLVNVYVPNSGSDLKRLDYRVNNWDQKLAEHIERLQSLKPKYKVILVGDMNVAHEPMDFHNPDCLRTLKQPGTTPQEQQSFKRNFLERSRLIDTFRHQNPAEKGYSFYSARLGDRGRSNKLGMRLDYILLGGHEKNEMAFEAYIEEKIGHPLSDHCPVGLQLKL